MRIWVQLRAPRDAGQADNWQRSIYVAPGLEDRVVYFDDLSPAGRTETVRPPLDRVRSILFVVDPVHTKRETAGRIWIKRAALQRATS
jgi:hypothetical protein